MPRPADSKCALVSHVIPDVHRLNGPSFPYMEPTRQY